MIDQFLHYALQPQTALFVVAFGLSLFQFHLKSRRRMLAMKCVSDYCYATYYFIMHAASGGLGALIAGTGGLMQGLTPDRYMKKTRYYRIGGAVVLAILAILISSHRLIDMLPLLGVIIARFNELSSSQQRIRVGLFLTFPLWIIYNYMHGLYFILIANFTVLASLSWAIYKHHRLKLAPEPV